jgi:hypothetical protein
LLLHPLLLLRGLGKLTPDCIASICGLKCSAITSPMRRRRSRENLPKAFCLEPIRMPAYLPLIACAVAVSFALDAPRMMSAMPVT